jgi:hypothetical protein
MKVFDLIGQYCWFHLGKCLIPWMKVFVFIINLSVVYRCFNNCTTEVAAVYQAVARVFWPSGPTHGVQPPPLFLLSESSLSGTPGTKSHQQPLECLASEVVECYVLSRTIVQVPANSAEWHQVNASCNFKRGAWNNWPSAWEFSRVLGSSFNQCIL